MAKQRVRRRRRDHRGVKLLDLTDNSGGQDRGLVCRWRDPVDGKMKQQSMAPLGITNKIAALTWAKAKSKAVLADRAAFAIDGTLSVRVSLQDSLAAYMAGFTSKNTLKAKAGTLSKFSATLEALGVQDMASIKTPLLARWNDSVAKGGDTSASMLDDTIVNVIRRRNLSDAQKRASTKWRQAIKTVEWLVSQLPPDARFQLVTFNVLAQPVLGAAGPDWIDTGDSVSVDKAIDALREVIPGKGTSLLRAFTAIRNLKPRPDNVFLLTDGLPTQGESKPFGNTVTGKQRLRFFDQAVDELPKGIPVNTILFPMEGDPFAASAFWKLTMASKGSMISPSKDWP